MSSRLEKEAERHVQNPDSIESLGVSPQGVNLPRFGNLREIRDGSRAIAVHEQIVAYARRKRRLARWAASTSACPLERSVDRTHMTTTAPADMAAQIIHLEADDEIALKYLGAAVVLQWHNLPEAVQQSLLQQAHSVGGLPPVGQLRDQIKALIGRVRG